MSLFLVKCSGEQRYLSLSTASYFWLDENIDTIMTIFRLTRVFRFRIHRSVDRFPVLTQVNLFNTMIHYE
jgi:hypothetical protein